MKIGLRKPGKAPATAEFFQWCAENGFDAVDVGLVTPEIAQAAKDAGLEIGTSDLAGTGDLVSSDPAKQQAGVEAAQNAIQAAADHGVDKMFCVFVPANREQKRADSFAIWKETFPAVAQFAEQRGVRIAMEGWPGPAPTYPALGCTPEMWRAMFQAVPSQAFGLNFDPSHLVRIGIDYMRALDEFGDRVIHVHGKDTEIDEERMYEHGNLGPTFRQARAFGESWWRYTIPGDGIVDWGRMVAHLEDLNFDGIISVELEDWRFHETWEKQAEGLVRSRQHLEVVVR